MSLDVCTVQYYDLSVSALQSAFIRTTLSVTKLWPLHLPAVWLFDKYGKNHTYDKAKTIARYQVHSNQLIKKL